MAKQPKKADKAGKVRESDITALFMMYREAVRKLEAFRRDAQERGERDDLPRVKIPTPVVKPKGVTTQQIRKAVRKAVQEYSERHAKPT